MNLTWYGQRRATACGYATMNLLMTATPLAMDICGLPFADTAFILQWHVTGTFAPSLFTVDLIPRFGVLAVRLVTGGGWATLNVLALPIVTLTALASGRWGLRAAGKRRWSAPMGAMSRHTSRFKGALPCAVVARPDDDRREFLCHPPVPSGRICRERAVTCRKILHW